MAIRGMLCALAVAAAMPASAAEQIFSGEYRISYLGLTIARTTFNSRFDAGTYKVEGTVTSAGLAALFDDTRGTVSTSGRFAAGTTQAAAFRVNYTEGTKSQLTTIAFQDGTVTSTVNIPPLKKRGGDWIPLQPAHLTSVTDPLSATLVRADSPAEVCRRTVRIYDGEMRADLTLTPDPKGELDVSGYDGPKVTCRLGFTPVSGYRKGRKALEFLKNRSQMRVAFAPLGTTGVYAPIYATIGTQIGTLTVTARRFEPDN